MSIRDVALMVAKAMNFEGKVIVSACTSHHVNVRIQ